jgi:hypothetical protein
LYRKLLLCLAFWAVAYAHAKTDSKLAMCARRTTMVRAELSFLIAATVLGFPAIAFADEVPSYDVRGTCRVEAQDVATTGGAAACVTQEQQAREALVSQWAQFAPESRTTCMQAQDGFSPSYVELLTCLQIAREVKGLPSPVR